MTRKMTGTTARTMAGTTAQSPECTKHTNWQQPDKNTRKHPESAHQEKRSDPKVENSERRRPLLLPRPSHGFGHTPRRTHRRNLNGRQPRLPRSPRIPRRTRRRQGSPHHRPLHTLHRVAPNQYRLEHHRTNPHTQNEQDRLQDASYPDQTQNRARPNGRAHTKTTQQEDTKCLTRQLSSSPA